MSRASIDSLNSRRWSNVTSLSNENLDNLYKMVPMSNSYYTNGFPRYSNGYSRPITYSKFPYMQAKKSRKFDVIKHSPPKGLIFVWPQKRNFYYEREYSFTIRVLAQILYWLTEFGFFPTGAGAPVEKPAWSIKQPIPKPENRDYIIEPDWNSVYYDT